MLRREFRQKVGGRLPDALAQAAGRRLELPGLHLRGDRPGLGEGGFAGLHGEYRLQGRGRPIPVVGLCFCKLASTVGAGAVLLDSSLIPSPPIMPQDRARVDAP